MISLKMILSFTGAFTQFDGPITRTRVGVRRGCYE